MSKISLVVLFTAAVLVSGCYTKAYREAFAAQQAQQAQQTQSAQNNTNQAAGQSASQANK
jgi:hypothetical protein